MRLALIHSGESFPYEKPFYELDCQVRVFYTSTMQFDKLAETLFDGYVFTGGSDVTPRLYGAEPNRKSVWDFNRDCLEAAVFQLAIRNNKPMIGICRGFQFLAVMMGNALHQHIDGHQSSHLVETDQVLNPREHHFFQVNSLHHQAVATVGPQGRILLRAETDAHIEAGCWGRVDHETIFGVQYHPELMNSYQAGYKWFLRSTEKVFNNAITNQS